MKCPMKFSREPEFDHRGGCLTDYNCDEDECEWWDETNNCCAIFRIAISLTAMVKRMEEK